MLIYVDKISTYDYHPFLLLNALPIDATRISRGVMKLTKTEIRQTRENIYKFGNICTVKCARAINNINHSQSFKIKLPLLTII